MKKEHTLKRLQSQLSKSEAEVKALKIEISNKQKELATKEKISASLLQQIKEYNLKPESTLKVRVKGMDIKAIEEEMVDKQLLLQTSTLGGNGTYPTPDNKFQYVIRNNVIITVKDPNDKK